MVVLPTGVAKMLMKIIRDDECVISIDELVYNKMALHLPQLITVHHLIYLTTLTEISWKLIF